MSSRAGDLDIRRPSPRRAHEAPRLTVNIREWPNSKMYLIWMSTRRGSIQCAFLRVRHLSLRFGMLHQQCAGGPQSMRASHRILISRRPVLLVGSCAALYLIIAGHSRPAPRFLYNPSASAPRGWYWVSPAERLKVDDYVLVNLPLSAKRLAADRGYLPESVPLLKRIGALSDQFVCVQGRFLWIDGKLA